MNRIANPTEHNPVAPGATPLTWSDLASRRA